MSDPTKLILAWQADDAVGDRFRWAVAEVTPAAEGCRLRYYSDEEFDRLNDGRTYGQLTDYGYRGYPGFAPKHSIHTSGVAEASLRRLPPRARSDFEAYQAHFRIPPNAKLSDLALLGITEAKLPNDGFSLVDPFISQTAPLELLNEVAGHRYYMANLARVPSVGDTVEIVAEPGNAADAGAVQFLVKGAKIGNVNRLQAPAFLRWLQSNRVSGVIERINGKLIRPRIFVFVEVRPLE
jgi:hypothetical protein